MAKNDPWFAWYADDWLSDEKLRACSPGARGLWADMLSLMHKCDRRGYLSLNGRPLTLDQLARMTGCSTEEVSRLLTELLNSGVPSVLDDGTIYSRRMVRDAEKRAKCSAAGHRGVVNKRRKHGIIETHQGQGQGASKGEAKPTLQHRYGCGSGVLKEDPNSEETHTSGIGGVGEGATLQGQTQGPPKRPGKGRAVDALDSDFDRFWHAYPRKQGPMAAREAWDELNPDAALVAEILDGVERWRTSREWRGGFVAYPARWLKEQRWRDEIAATPMEETYEQKMERLFRGDGA